MVSNKKNYTAPKSCNTGAQMTVKSDETLITISLFRQIMAD